MNLSDRARNDLISALLLCVPAGLFCINFLCCFLVLLSALTIHLTLHLSLVSVAVGFGCISEATPLSRRRWLRRHRPWLRHRRRPLLGEYLSDSKTSAILTPPSLSLSLSLYLCVCLYLWVLVQWPFFRAASRLSVLLIRCVQIVAQGDLDFR
jgi:hypothetical protein